ncbi:MAG TPA: DUF2169 domain-containing protein [Polyangiaceae bacterium]|nr:DUF2169 domain-containing protein [Polyangiaceae bacterium]
MVEPEAMRLSNSTGAVARLHMVDFLEPQRRAVVIVKKTYAVAEDGTLGTVSDPMPFVPLQLATGFGSFHGEFFFRKRGVDLCVLGTVQLDEPVRRMRVRLEVGGWSHELEVTGDRVWVDDGTPELKPSDPTPFVEMPISYGRAFGGSADVGGAEVPWTDNPEGVGYYESRELAIGKPLPNLTTPGAAASRWDDRQRVVGWGPYPMYWGLRAARAVSLDRQRGEIIDITPELFNHAHPDLILECIRPLTPIRVDLGARPFELRVPSERPCVDVRVGTGVFEALGDLDGLFLWPNARRLVVTWRARFRYPVRAEEVRQASLSFVA